MMDQNSTAPPREPRDVVAVVAVYALVSFIGGFVVAAIAKGHHEPSVALEIIVVSFVLTETNLVAVWLGLGNMALPLRLLIGIPAAGIVFLPWMIDDAPPLAFGFSYLAVLVVAGPLLLMRIFGGRLVQFRQQRIATNESLEDRPFQFTLRQMFSWTLSVAMVAALIRLVFNPVSKDLGGNSVVEILLPLASCLAIGIAACATVWAALSKGSPLVRLPLVIGAAAFIALSICVAFDARPVAIVGTSSVAATTPLFTGVALLMLRSIGFRLVRGGRKESFRSDESEARAKL